MDDAAILPGVRHPNLWPAIGPTPNLAGESVTVRTFAVTMAVSMRDVPAVVEAKALGVYVFVKLGNGQEFEAHVIERTRRAKP